MRYLRPSAEFREIFQYNNLLYHTLGYLPEALVNQTLSAYVDHHIFKPLGMTDSTYSIADAEKHLLADGFQISGQDLRRGLNGTKKPIIPFYERPGEESVGAGSGGVISSARDMVSSLMILISKFYIRLQVNWVSMLLVLGKHPYQGQQIVPTEVVNHAATGRSIVAGKASFPEMVKFITSYAAGYF